MKRLVSIPLLGKKRNIERILERVLMFYKKLDDDCKYDTINQVFVKNIYYSCLSSTWRKNKFKAICCIK